MLVHSPSPANLRQHGVQLSQHMEEEWEEERVTPRNPLSLAECCLGSLSLIIWGTFPSPSSMGKRLESKVARSSKYNPIGAIKFYTYLLLDESRREAKSLKLCHMAPGPENSQVSEVPGVE